MPSLRDIAESQLPEVGVWRDLHTGVNPMWTDPEWADGATDQPGDPDMPIDTRIDGPWGLPWYDGMEDPWIPTGLSTSPDLGMPVPDLGWEPIVGAYDGAYRTLGPVRAWGHEPSGGLGGDQAIGRIMRFPANIPDRYDPNGVWNLDYHDELAASIAMGDIPLVTETQYTTDLMQWPNVWNRY